MKSLAALAVLAVATIGSAGAATIQYNTTGSTFVSSGTSTLTVVSGTNTLTLAFNALGNSSVTVPSGISYGFLDVSYSGAAGVTITVPAFQLNLHINNVTDGKTGIFAVTSAGGTVSAAQDTVVVSFAPIPLIVGTASFTANSPLNLVSDATLAGQTSFQGGVNLTGVPEPGTMFLLGAGLLGIGFTARKKFANRS